MKTIIYYFSGTGNSLAAAKKIAEILGDCTLEPIARHAGDRGDIVPPADRVGIVCPVYFTGLPVMVDAFARRLDLSRLQYTFALVTYGGSGAAPALHQLDAGLRMRGDHGLDAGFSVAMPGNYILMYGSPAGEKRDTMLAMAAGGIEEAAAIISRCERQALPSSLLAGLVHALMYPRFASRVHTDDSIFTVSDACTSCGTCAAICPAGNIELVDGRPVWQHRCELCCGCIHACPVQAIQAGAGTEKRPRYRNPSVTVAELKQQGPKP
jgi:ferredoxin